jgi:phosphopantothenoylcysteine decarboxylase/phosphopantothenate--cysteine ligase
MNVLVTAGPTREFIDPVRFISNRSSGKMGYAVASAAAARGHTVALVSGPVALAAPAGVALRSVVSAQEMQTAVRELFPTCDALVMCAAVADWRPRARSPVKLKKERMSAELPLERTPDILAGVAAHKGRRIVVGFAAETDRVEEEAERKLRAKGLDLIVANDVGRADSGFDADTNQVVFLAADGTRRAWPLMTKKAVARKIIAWIERRYRVRQRR